MPETVIVTTNPPQALERLQRALVGYRDARAGRTSEDVLVKKGEDLAQRQPGGNSLHALFRAQAGRFGRITAAARLRGFRLGRRKFGGTGLTRGISETAKERAEKLMGPYLKTLSILATVHTDEYGRITLRGVRQGARGKRILGGRRGLKGWAVGGDSALRMAGDVRLNFRAVATAMEINLREAGRGFLAAGFLFRRFVRLKKQRVLREVQPRSRIAPDLAAAALEGSTDGSHTLTLRLTSYVPGTAAVGTARGVFQRALDFMTTDLEAYLARKQRETLVGEVRKAVA